MNDEAVRERNIDQVRAFFRSERELDIDGWSALWSDNAIRRTPFAPPGFPQEQRGKSAIVARARTGGELRSGTTYENEVVAFFRFDDDGRIAEWTGYMNPLPILALVGRATSAGQ